MMKETYLAGLKKDIEDTNYALAEKYDAVNRMVLREDERSFGRET